MEELATHIISLAELLDYAKFHLVRHDWGGAVVLPCYIDMPIRQIPGLLNFGVKYPPERIPDAHS